MTKYKQLKLKIAVLLLIVVGQSYGMVYLFQDFLSSIYITLTIAWLIILWIVIIVELIDAVIELEKYKCKR